MKDIGKILKISTMILLGFLMTIIVLAVLHVILNDIHPPYKPTTPVKPGGSSASIPLPESPCPINIK